MNISEKVNIWEKCDPSTTEAINCFQKHWGPYSSSSRRYPIINLVEEIIDPAVNVYMNSIPASYKMFIPGAEAGIGFSGMLKLIGFEPYQRLQRQLLRQFCMTTELTDAQVQCFIDTVESLITLVGSCQDKRPKKSSMAPGVNLNDKRIKRFCKLCGELTEFAKFAASVDANQINDLELLEHTKLELSHQYCNKHRPKLTCGKWNSIYKRDRRSLDQFNTELQRLTNQCAKRAQPNAKSGNALIDQYFFRLMLNLTLQPADKAELRNLARRMVDSKLSDAKKRMLLLKRTGFSQAEIGKQILNVKQQPITRQAVSKALASVRKEFLL